MYCIMVFTTTERHIDNYGWREQWGMKFKWTPEHPTPEGLMPLIHTYDTVATEAVERLDEISPPSYAVELYKHGGVRLYPGKRMKRDLYDLLRQHATSNEKVRSLWSEVNTVPDWVDWEQIEKGQRVFYRYGGPAITAVSELRLGGMGSGRTVETLDRTGGFSVDVVRRRLLETTQHVLNVTRDLESIKPGGDGFADSVRVRLLHATVRRRIMKMATVQPSYYDIRTLGVPINDLDCIGTINTLSAAVAWMGLPRQGIYLRKQEIVDYLALWRYVAYLLGARHDWMATPESARRMMESLLVTGIRPSGASGNLANNIITGLQDQPPTYASREFICAQAYWLNGRELAEALGVERPGPYYFALTLGQCILFATLSYMNRSFSSLDERNIKLVRKALYTVLLRDKSKGALGYTAKFNLKHIPSFDKPSTSPAPFSSSFSFPPCPLHGSSSSPNSSARESRGKEAKGKKGEKPRRAERAALTSLLVSAAIVGVVSAWCCVKVAGLITSWLAGRVTR